MTEPPQEWIEVQDALKRRLILKDDFAFVIDPNQPNSSHRERLRYVGGVDLSFLKEDPCVACGALVVIDLENNLLVVYEDFAVVRLDVPYIPGFLAFREAPVLLELLEKMKRQTHPFYPQLLMVDGNGLLHPRGFGLACHLGVLADLPTIGVGKNLHHVDGLTQSGMRQLLEVSENCAKDLFFLTGNSGCTWGGALRSTPGSSKPIFISTGNRISLESSIKVVKMCCKYRVPESIRQADISSRAYLKNLEGSLMQHASNEPDWCGKEPSEDQQMTINLGRRVNLESTYVKGRAGI